MSWFQHKLQLPRFSQGIHPITHLIVEEMQEISRFRVGLLHVFIQHTSASLTINENADPDVLVDLNLVMDSLAPENFHYRHTEEGGDDMPGHVKSSLLGSSLSIPIDPFQLHLRKFPAQYYHRQPSRQLLFQAHGAQRSVESKLLYFPDEFHFVTKPQNARLWWDTVLGWFEKHK